MYVCIGLGNPGPDYRDTRHNVGFMVLDRIGEQRRLRFKKGKGPYQFTYYTLQGHRIVLVKPLTFMNLSGQAVRAVIDYYQITDFSRILIIVDDLNLPFGTLRLRPEGSHGGQKGLQSVISVLGIQQIPRLRIGIGNHYSDAVNFVLSPFTKEQQADVPLILKYAAEAVESFVINGIEFTMSRFNRKLLDK